jgi:hypothetical protein
MVAIDVMLFAATPKDDLEHIRRRIAERDKGKK